MVCVFLLFLKDNYGSVWTTKIIIKNCGCFAFTQLAEEKGKAVPDIVGHLQVFSKNKLAVSGLFPNLVKHGRLWRRQKSVPASPFHPRDRYNPKIIGDVSLWNIA